MSVVTFLSRDQIKAAQDVTFETVAVPEWGEGAQVRIKSLRAKQREELIDSITVRKGKGKKSRVEVQSKGLYAELCILAVCKPDSDDLAFTADDAGWLMEKAAAPVFRIGEAVLKHNGISGADEEDDEEGEGSAPVQSDASRTA